MSISPASAHPATDAAHAPGRASTRPAAPSSRRLAGLQQLRFAAALLVLVHHTLEECSAPPGLPVARWLVLLGACGVDIFFVISGFVVWRTAVAPGPEVSAGAFMARRLLRVLPLYWLVLGLVVVLWATGLALRSVPVTPTSLVGSFLLLPPAEGRRLVLGVAWTLVYEVYFYALCALALCVPRERFRLPVLLAMLAIVPRLLVAAGAVPAGGYYGHPIVLEFAFGCLIARWSDVAVRPGAARRAAVAGIAGLVAAAWLLASDGTAGLSRDVRWWGWGVPAALLVAACAAGLRIPDRAGGRVLAVLGDASYALYLTHGFAMIGLARWLKAGGARDVGATMSLGAVAILGSVALACVVHAWIELPLMRWLGARGAAPGRVSGMPRGGR